MAYIYALLEHLGGDKENFFRRLIWVGTFSAPGWDLTFYKSGALNKIKLALKELAEKLPPMKGNLADFIKKCRQGGLSEE